MDAETRAKLDILSLKINQDDRHREEVTRKLYEAEDAIKKLEDRLKTVEGDRPSRKELYATAFVVLGITLAVCVPIALA